MIRQRGIQFIIVLFVLSLFVAGCVDYSVAYDDGSGTNLTDLEAVNGAVSNFSADDILFAIGDSTNSVRYDFVVPVTGDYETTIVWTTSDNSFLQFVETDNIRVTNRPSSADQTITLTATISRGTNFASVTVLVNVKMEVEQIMTVFEFLKAENSFLTADVLGDITRVDDFNYDINLIVSDTVPWLELVATFEAGVSEVKVDGVIQTNNVTKNDFNDVVTYDIVDGGSTQFYEVIVNTN